MSSFTTELKYEDIPPTYRKSKITEEFEYHVGSYPSELVITVPVGFVTDWASIPRIFWPIIPPRGKYSKAALVHDYMYVEALQTKKVADNIFHEAMLVLGVNRVLARIMYFAVRIGGRGNYA